MAAPTIKNGPTAQQLGADEKKTPKTIPGFRVRTAHNGFRRGGREWHGVTEVAASELTKDQVAQIKAEPKLVVEDIRIAVAEADPDPDTDTGK
jgi:hypothetical protein